MSVTMMALAFLLAALALEAAALPRRPRSGWRWFAAWTAAGAVAAFAALSFVGLLVLPVALLAIFAVSRFALWPDVLGLGAGAGLTATAIAALNLDGAAGGPDPLAWFTAGLAAAAASVLLYALLRRGGRPAARGAA